MSFVETWNKYKMWLAPFVAIFLWLISVICFVYGLSFKNPILIMTKDVSLFIAFGLSLSNTAIQVLGNGMKLESDNTDGVFFWIWIASYALGISSNTNTLLQVLGIESKVLEWIIAIALGAIIEIAPEKMIIMWLRSFKPEKKQTFQPYSYKPQNQQSQGKKHNGGGFQRRQELERNYPKNTPSLSHHNIGFEQLAQEVMQEENNRLVNRS